MGAIKRTVDASRRKLAPARARRQTGKAIFRTCPRGAADFRRGSLGCGNGDSCDQACGCVFERRRCSNTVRSALRISCGEHEHAPDCLRRNAFAPQAYRGLLSKLGWELSDFWKLTDEIFEYKQRCKKAGGRSAFGDCINPFTDMWHFNCDVYRELNIKLLRDICDGDEID